MSSLSPKADMLPVSHHVRFGPQTVTDRLRGHQPVLPATYVAKEAIAVRQIQ